MSPTSMKMIAYVVIGLVLMVVFAAAFVWYKRKQQHQDVQRFRIMAEALGFTQSRAAHYGHIHWVGEWKQRKVVLGYYISHMRIHTYIGQSGVLLMMHGGALPDGKAGAELLIPPKIFGEGSASLEVLLTKERLSRAVKIPNATLFPADELMRGSIQDLVIKNGTENGWKGLAMRSVLAKTSSQSEIQQTLDEMVAWLDDL